jgi:hypothetical protein
MEKRPTLNDPKEWALIRSMYFNDRSIDSETTDPIERLERQESKQRNLNKNSR